MAAFGSAGGGGSNGALTSLSAFRFDRVLDTSAAAKSAVVLGCFEGKEGAAILSIEKKAFDPEAVGALLGPRAILKLDFQNAEYGVYSMEVPADSNTIKCDVIFPATAKHIAKYQAPDYRLLVETPEMYQAITKPYIEREELGDRIQWVYNVLDKKKESERILLEDADNTTGFMMIPDMKWDQTTTANLHCLAIVHARTLPSLRALTADHLPLLENVLQKGSDEITRRFGVPPSKLRVYLHYQPTFYHLHVHFTHLDFVTTAGIEIGRAHLLRDVIDNIKLQPTYYQERSLEMLTTSSLGLCKEFTKAGYISTN